MIPTQSAKHVSPAFLMLAFGLLTVAMSPYLVAQEQGSPAKPVEQRPVSQTKDKPAAAVGDQLFYEKDVIASVQAKINDLRNQEYQLRVDAVEEAVDKYLLKKEAEKRHTTEEELLKQVDAKVAGPSQEERDRAIVSQMFGGAPVSSVGEEFDKELQQQKVQLARKAFFQKLRQENGVNFFMLPDPVEVAPDPQRVRGNPNAKITMIEFSDFQCPFCEQAYAIVKGLLKKYDGKVKLSYRDLPLQPTPLGMPSKSEAARCAAEQGKFWEYHDILFENQDSFGEPMFREYAESLKMDVDQFSACLKSGKYREPVDRDLQEAMRLGIKGTPAFYINGVFLSGAQPPEEFEGIIDTELYLLDHF